LKCGKAAHFIVSTRFLRPLLIGAAATAAIVLGSSVAGAADTPGSTPSTLTGGAAVTATTTTTVAPTTTTVVTVAPTTTSTSPPANQTRILPAPTPTASPGAATDAGGATTLSTVKPTTTTPPQSLTAGQVDEVLRNQQKSGANSTAALLEALKPLQNLGMSAQEALAVGMGQFPVQGLANWTDDFGDPRDGPPPHSHQGDDLFTQFDTPVRAPADGTVRFETGGLGGLAAYVTTADGTYYYMAHLNSYANLASGAAVKQGQTVGFAGDSGNAKGGAPHVHFEVHPLGGAAVNPKPIVDAWVAAAVARVPELIASLQPPTAADAGSDPDQGLPQILVDTGLTRRFSLAPAAAATPAPVTPPAGSAPLPGAPLAD
jgi:murein DD-endopeptidase MepM/ murein hydrolase activator NlpD